MARWKVLFGVALGAEVLGWGFLDYGRYESFGIREWIANPPPIAFVGIALLGLGSVLLAVLAWTTPRPRTWRWPGFRTVWILALVITTLPPAVPVARRGTLNWYLDFCSMSGLDVEVFATAKWETNPGRIVALMLIHVVASLVVAFLVAGARLLVRRSRAVEVDTGPDETADYDDSVSGRGAAPDPRQHGEPGGA